MISSLKNCLYLYQKPDASNNEYPKEVKAEVETINDYRACVLGKFPCLVEDIIMEKYDKSMEDATQAEMEECSKEGNHGSTFLHGADKIRYRGAKKHKNAEHVNGHQPVPQNNRRISKHTQHLQSDHEASSKREATEKR